MNRQAPRRLISGHRPGAVLLGTAFLGMAVWSWRRWPDLLVDFGQQLYIPWRLASGERLYTDIAFLHGPLSQHANALVFLVFGTSLRTLAVVNLAILAGLTVLVYRSFVAPYGRATATAACLALLSVSGFAHLARVGNYNFVCPYTHESTHGLALTVAMLVLLLRWIERGECGAAALAGLCFGLALLTKAEVALAASVTLALAGLVAIIARGARPPRGRAAQVFFAATALAPAAGFFLYFLSYMPAVKAARAILGGWVVLGSEVARNPFYLHAAGLDDPAGNLRRMLLMFALLAGLTLSGAVLDVVWWRVRGGAASPSPAGGSSGLGARPAAGLALFAILIAAPDALPWAELPRALPLASLLALGATLILLVRRRRDPAALRAVAPMVLWSGLALALLGKTALNTHLYHYGFYLALPATLVLVVGLTHWLPKALRVRGGDGRLFQGMAFAIVAAGIVYHLRWSNEFFRLKDLAVGGGGDTILTYGPGVRPEGAAASLALRWMETGMPREATFVAFPEGITLNYLSRHPTTSPCLNFMMTEMIVFGEEWILDRLKDRPPDYVLLVHKDTAEFGVGFFGADPAYGRRIMEWVGRNYASTVLVGYEPLKDERFGIKILARVHDGSAATEEGR
jgi:hypothetical protein